MENSISDLRKELKYLQTENQRLRKERNKALDKVDDYRKKRKHQSTQPNYYGYVPTLPPFGQMIPNPPVPPTKKAKEEYNPVELMNLINRLKNTN